MTYTVIVGNLGVVYTGKDLVTAKIEFEDYKLLSELGYGRAGNEDVTLLDEERVLEAYSGVVE